MPDLDNFSGLTAQSILEVVRNPTSNLTAAVLIGAALILVLLMLVLLAWAFLLFADEPDEARQDGGEEERGSRGARRRKRPAGALAFLLVGGLVALAIGGTASGRDEHCLRCHEEIVSPEAIGGAHGPCISCHERRGALHLPARAVRRLRMELQGLFGKKPGENLGGWVADAECVGCHEMDALDVIAAESVEASGSVGVRMSHNEPLDAGVHCVDCHGAVGAHVALAEPTGHPTMNDCIDCHDGLAAPVECALCHEGDPVRAVRVEPGPMTKTRLQKPTDCSGCHSVESCDECHGIRLPHSERFIKGDHAGQAAFSGRQKNCVACHSTQWCIDGCHPNGKATATWGHPPDWAASHAHAAPDTCTNCHSEQFDCDYCHP